MEGCKLAGKRDCLGLCVVCRLGQGKLLPRKYASMHLWVRVDKLPNRPSAAPTDCAFCSDSGVLQPTALCPRSFFDCSHSPETPPAFRPVERPEPGGTGRGTGSRLENKENSNCGFSGRTGETSSTVPLDCVRRGAVVWVLGAVWSAAASYADAVVSAVGAH